jgi:hypothetical protein
MSEVQGIRTSVYAIPPRNNISTPTTRHPRAYTPKITSPTNTHTLRNTNTNPLTHHLRTQFNPPAKPKTPKCPCPRYPPPSPIPHSA